MEWVTSEHQAEVLAAEIKLNNVAIAVIADCETCNPHPAACERHRAFIQAVNEASVAMEQANRELRKLGK